MPGYLLKKILEGAGLSVEEFDALSGAENALNFFTRFGYIATIFGYDGTRWGIFQKRREGWFMASTVTLRRAENRLLAILNDLPESAVEYVIAYARSLREQILDEEDELDRLAQERFAKLCEERERTYERIGEEEALEIACDLIHQRRRRELGEAAASGA